LSQAATDKPNSPEPKRSNGFRISRRAFLGVSAAAAAVLAVVLALKRPKIGAEEGYDSQTTNALAKPEEYISTSCLNCPTRCAIQVRRVTTVRGKTKVVKIRGNSASTYSEGKCCSRSHVGLEVLYNPDRFAQPMIRRPDAAKGRGTDYDNDFDVVSWDEALGKIATRLGATAPDKILILEGLNTTSNEDLIRQFALAYGTPNLFKEEGLETDADREGKLLADGRLNSWYELQAEDETSTKYILSFSAGIVESERPLARNLHLWGELRRSTPNRTKVVAFDPRYSVMACRADEWVPINPGTEGALAMAMAQVIIKEGLYDSDFINDYADGFNKYRTVAMTQRFSPESVSEIAGVSADTIRRIAQEFARSKPAIAWSGEAATGWPYGTFASHAIYCLNALVGSIDVPGGIVYQRYPDYAPMPSDGLPITETGVSFRKMAELLRDGGINTAIGFNSNLIMSVPESKEDGKWDEELKNLFYVHVGPAKSEMAAYADIILPACTYLEDWGYESAIPGSGYAEARIKQPVIEPVHEECRPTGRVVFDLANGKGPAVSRFFTPISSSSETFAQDFAMYRTAPLMPWKDFKSVGVWKGSSYSYRGYESDEHFFDTPSGKFEFHSDHLERLLNVRLPGEDTVYPLELSIYRPVLEIRSGSQNFPWAQEMYLVMHGRGWKNLVEINRETAHEYGIGEGDEVIVESVYGEIEGEARVLEGMRPGVVAIATGQGHFASGRFADGMGCNPMDVMGTEYDEESGQPSLFSTRVSVHKA
jgi:thiosulfate reductase/polysulfide reductase chain A